MNGDASGSGFAAHTGAVLASYVVTSHKHADTPERGATAFEKGQHSTTRCPAVNGARSAARRVSVTVCTTVDAAREREREREARGGRLKGSRGGGTDGR